MNSLSREFQMFATETCIVRYGQTRHYFLTVCQAFHADFEKIQQCRWMLNGKLKCLCILFMVYINILVQITLEKNLIIL